MNVLELASQVTGPHAASKCEISEISEQSLPAWDTAVAKRLLTELRAEVERIKGEFSGSPPALLATLLADALAIGGHYVRDHAAETARGWDPIELLRELQPHVRDIAVRWRGASSPRFPGTERTTTRN